MNITQNIRDDIRRVPIDDVIPNEWNPNRQTDYIFEKEKNSIQEFGFLDPILVREVDGNFEIIDGEHRWKAAKELGYSEILVNNLGEVSKSIAGQLTIILNEVKGQADRMDMAALVKSLKEEVPVEHLLRNLPFTETDFQSLIIETNIDWDKVNASMAKGPSENDSGNQSSEPKQPESGEEKFITFSVALPESVFEQLKQQLDRFKIAMYPNEMPENVSPVLPMEAMIQHLAQIPDEQLLG